MSDMDCQTFDSSLLEALYDELDDRTSTAMDEHAASCTSCASRIEQLKKTRELVQPALVAPLPDDLEDRILAAATAAMDAPRSNVVSLDARREDDAEPKRGATTGDEQARGGGKVIAFFSRPQLAIAATFLLVLGAAALFARSSSQEKSAAREAAMAQAPAATATATAATMADDAVPGAAATVAPAGSLLALAEHAPPPSPAFMDPREGAKAKGGRPAPSPRSAQPSDPAFLDAKAAYDAGRYAEALPKFEAISARVPEAELYVARCLVHTKGCKAAVSHFDAAARRSSGTETGSRAALEAARCVKKEGEAIAARGRFVSLEKDAHVGDEASAELATLDDAPRATVKAAKPAKPAATTTATHAKPANETKAFE